MASWSSANCKSIEPSKTHFEGSAWMNLCRPQRAPSTPIKGTASSFRRNATTPHFSFFSLRIAWRNRTCACSPRRCVPGRRPPSQESLSSRGGTGMPRCSASSNRMSDSRFIIWSRSSSRTLIASCIRNSCSSPEAWATYFEYSLPDRFRFHRSHHNLKRSTIGYAGLSMIA